MSKVFSCAMEMTMYLDIRADSEEDALYWLQHHTFEDVKNETTYWDVECDDRVIDETKDDDWVGIDISTEEDENES